MHRLLYLVLLFILSVQAYGQVLINEFSASNIIGITDEDGDRCDWIELFNASATEANLAGCHLSDAADRLNKWTFPAISLKPGSFLLVFASGKDRTDLPVSYQTIISKGDSWKYIVPSSSMGDSWKNTGYNDAGWTDGQSGFGYGDNDDATLLNSIMSVYIRKEFTITNLADISSLVLSIDYDDGFVAYLNGQEIARSNLGTPGTPVAYNQAATSHEATMFSGGYPGNYFITDFAPILAEGTNVLAIEGHNTGTSSTDLSLTPMLSLVLRGGQYLDDIPDYIQLTGKKLHANFKIAAGGETLIFSNPDSSVIDSIPGTALIADISYGHKPDGFGPYFYFAEPTPGSSNLNDGFTTLPAGDTVVFSAKGGYYPGGFQLSLSSKDPADTIFYTLDGSEPSRDDPVYSSPIMISGNCVVRAVALNIHKLPGVVSTNTYITRIHKLPVVCLSTDPYNLWDYNYGIYVMGPNADPNYPYFGANFWQDWERKAHMEYYDLKGTKQIDQDVGIKIYGNYSRGNDQKSLALFARKEYGKGSFKYKFFADKPIDEFESLVLRNGGNDWDRAIIRDGLTSTLIRNMDVDRMAFQPAIVYLNGEYWGILNLREKINPNYIAENHFVDPANVNLLENNASVLDGTSTSFIQLRDYMNSNTLETDSKYQQACSMIDVNNFIQYQLTQIFIDNRDWPGNNLKYWNTNEPGSRWRWIIFDTDFGFSIWTASAYTYNTLQFALAIDGPSWPNPPWSTLFLRRMLSNPGFKNEFINQYCDRLNTNFSSARVIEVVDSIKQLYIYEIDSHISRWGLNYTYWQTNYTNIRNFATNRPGYAREHLRSTLSLGDMLTIKVEVSSSAAGRVKVNTVIPDKYPFSGIYFRGVPIKLTAIPKPGYKFVRWEYGGFTSYTAGLDYNMSDAGRFRAIFEPAESIDNKLVINEINYNSSPEADAGDWVELYNAGSTTVNLKDWIISDAGAESGFKIPSDIILTPGAFAVICRDIESFTEIFPRTKNVAGDMGFGLSSSGDDINLYNPDGNLTDFVNYTTNSPWPADANGTGATIELIDPFRDNNLGQNWRSRYNGGSPGEKNILTDVNLDPEKYASVELSCFPNPFRDFTTVHFDVIIPGRYNLRVYDLQGRLLTSMTDKVFEPGSYTVDWDGRNSDGTGVNEGVYIIRLSGPGINRNIKVVYLGR